MEEEDDEDLAEEDLTDEEFSSDDTDLTPVEDRSLPIIIAEVNTMQ